jgi:hypothetical protein
VSLFVLRVRSAVLGNGVRFVAPSGPATELRSSINLEGGSKFRIAK